MEPGPSAHPVPLAQLSPGGLLPTTRPRADYQSAGQEDGGREVLVVFTRFHSTADSEIKDLVDLGFRVPSGVVPESNPQASPGTCNLEERRWEWGGAQAEPGSADAQARCLPGVGAARGVSLKSCRRGSAAPPALPPVAGPSDSSHDLPSLSLPVRWGDTSLPPQQHVVRIKETRPGAWAMCWP